MSSPSADLSAGARTTGDDPRVTFEPIPPVRRMKRIEVEMSCDQTSWSNIFAVCVHPDLGEYALRSNHFRVLRGRHRYAVALDGGFFADQQRMPADLLGYWRRDMRYLRFDPCEVIGATVALHRFRVL